MIRFVELENWRAYRSFRLELSPGTTFLVAPNGVGKSSFIEAVQWVLAADAKPLAAVMRLRATRSRVDIGLIAGEASVRIKRTLSVARSGRARTPNLETEAWIDDHTASIDEVFALLERQWAADSRFAARAAFLADRFAESRHDPDLRSHLTKLHGLDHVQDAADRIAVALKAATDRADTARKSAGVQRAELENAEQAVAAATALAAEADQAVADSRSAAHHSNAALAEAEAANATHDAYRAWRQARDDLARDLQLLLGSAPEEPDLRPATRAAAAAARAQLTELEARHARLEERLATVQTALEGLRAAGAECPICRRPLDDDTRGHAETQHRHDYAAAAGELETIETAPVRSVVAQLTDAVAKAEALGAPPKELPGEPIDVAPLQEQVAAAHEKLEQALGQAGRAQAEEGAARRHLQELRAAGTADSTVAMYTQVAALDAAKTALESTITNVLDTQLGPIVEEVNRRWEAIFPDRPGLRLDPHGHITRPFDDGANIDIDSFSTGERVVAKLLLRLATLTSTTQVPFCVIDEPLEHLDPDARSYVARTLAYLGMGEGLDQIFVTTYEQQLAVQLAGFAQDRVHLEFLRTAHVVD